VKSKEAQIIDLLESVRQKPELVGLDKWADALASIAKLTTNTKRPKGKAAAVADLRKMTEAVAAVYRAVFGLALEAHIELERQLGGTPSLRARTLSELLHNRMASSPVFPLFSGIHKLDAAARRATEVILAGEHPAPVGRPKKQGVPQFIEMAAHVFELLTGNLVSRANEWETGKPSSPFHVFLSRLFKITEIKASPDEQIRTFLKTHGEKSDQTPH
jgi:hypothetical protein